MTQKRPSRCFLSITLLVLQSMVLSPVALALERPTTYAQAIAAAHLEKAKKTIASQADMAEIFAAVAQLGSSEKATELAHFAANLHLSEASDEEMMDACEIAWSILNEAYEATSEKEVVKQLGELFAQYYCDIKSRKVSRAERPDDAKEETLIANANEIITLGEVIPNDQLPRDIQVRRDLLVKRNSTFEGSSVFEGPIVVNVVPDFNNNIQINALGSNDTAIIFKKSNGTEVTRIGGRDADGFYVSIDGGTTSNLAVSANGNTSISGSLKVDQSSELTGNVGIGKAPTSNALDIQGAIVTSGNASLGGSLGVTGATTLNSTLGVSSNTSIGGTLAVIGNASLGGSLDVTGSAALNSTLSVANNCTFSGNVGIRKSPTANALDINGALVTSGNTTIGGTLGVTGATTLSSTLGVTGNTTVGGTLGVSGATTLSSTLGVTGNTIVGGTLGVTGATTLNSTLGVTGNTTVGGTLGVTGATTLSSTLGVTGNATFSNAITIDSASEPLLNLIGRTNGGVDPVGPLVRGTFSGASTGNVIRLYEPNASAFANSADIVLENNFFSNTASPNTTGRIVFKTSTSPDSPQERVIIFNDGSSRFNGNIGINRAPTTNALDITGAIVASGNASVGGTLGVTGAATLSSTLGVTGNTTVGGTLGVTGAATLSSTLGVTGNATVGGTLGVTGATTLSSTLGVTGNATVGGTLGVTGNTTFNSAITIDSASEPLLQLIGRVTPGSDNIGPLIRGSYAGSSTNNVIRLYEPNTTSFVNSGDIVLENNFFGGASNTSGRIVLRTSPSINNPQDRLIINNDGATQINGNVGINKAPTSNALDITGAIVASGNASVGGTLGVTGATTLSSTLGVAGNTTVGGTLGVTGATTLSSTLGVTGNTTVSGTLGVTGNATFSSAVTIDSASEPLLNLIGRVNGGVDPVGPLVRGTFTGASTGNFIRLYEPNASALANSADIVLENNFFANTATPNTTGRIVFKTSQATNTPQERLIINNDGATQINGNVGINKAPTSNALDITGAIVASGNASIGGTLGVTGAATFNNTVGISNTTSLNLGDDNIGGFGNVQMYFTRNGDSTTRHAMRTFHGRGGGGTSDSIRFYLSSNQGNSNFLDSLHLDHNALRFYTQASGVTTQRLSISDTSSQFSTNLSVSGTSSLTGNTTVGGTLGVTGATTLSSTLGVTGNTTVGGTLGVTGAATLSSTLGVTGNATFNSAVTIDSNAEPLLQLIGRFTNGSDNVGPLIRGNYTGASTHNIIRLYEPNATNFLNSADIVLENNFFSSVTNSNTSGRIVFKTSTNAGSSQERVIIFNDGATQINGNVGINQAPTSNALDITGAIVASGNASIGGTLGVTGAATLSSTLGVAGNTTVGGTLGVTGATTLSSTLGVTGNTTVGGTLGVTGNATFNSAITIDSASEPLLNLIGRVNGSTDIVGPLVRGTFSGASTGNVIRLYEPNSSSLGNTADIVIENNFFANTATPNTTGRIVFKTSQATNTPQERVIIFNDGSSQFNSNATFKSAITIDSNSEPLLQLIGRFTNGSDNVGPLIRGNYDGATTHNVIRLYEPNSVVINSPSNSADIVIENNFFSSIANSNTSGRIVFKTSQATNTPQERLIIHNDGLVKINQNLDVQGALINRGSDVILGNPSTDTTYILNKIPADPATGSFCQLWWDRTGTSGTTGKLFYANCGSSVRYKDNIEEVSDEGIANLLQLRPITFTYKEEGESARTHYGLIAEEVNDYFPILVPKDAFGRPDTVNYEKITTLIIKYLQIQKAELDAKFANLEARLAALEALQ